jgi:phosphoenolpyruvate-protein phosphotransferase (PTS system enzyme I)
VRKLEGLSASRGIAIAPVFRFADETPVAIPRYSIDAADVAAQWARFESALERSRSDINLLIDDRYREQSEILGAHMMMLSDPEFIPQIKAALEAGRINIEAVLSDKIGETSSMLRSTGDTYLAERAVDIEDAFNRVMVYLLKDAKSPKGTAPSGSPGRFVPPGTIVVARSLKPSEALSLKASSIAGIALEEGGATSHVAILARSWGIPAVMGVQGLLDAVTSGESVILDAVEGVVICDPSMDLVSSYRSRARAEGACADGHARDSLSGVPAVTVDGEAVTLRANIAIADESALARAEGAEGVGLFRSEFLYLAQGTFPDEETQYLAYREAIEGMNGLPVVIRTLDSGGDKMVGEQISLAEKNPLLGWRAVRYCLDRREMFATQLRALLRAGVHGDLRIMFPMISNVEELDAVLDVLDEAKASLARDGIAHRADAKVGIMIEIPSAAVCADLLAKKVDFMSIGTNDLTQYTMACDRENAKVAHLFDGFNPAVLRLIRQTVAAAKDAHIEVSVCGEMGGDPASVFLMLGLGLRSFSMASSSINPVKTLVRKISVADAVALADAAMELSAAREIRKLIQERLKNYETE